MKYQTIKHLKTKSKVIALSDTLAEAISKIPSPFFLRELSYIGQFPIYTSEADKKTYSIQGLHSTFNVVLSLPKEEIEAIRCQLKTL